MHVQIIIVPYDTARRGWRCGAGPEHLVAVTLASYAPEFDPDQGVCHAALIAIDAMLSQPA